MTPSRERNLIFSSFVCVGVFIVGLVGYRAMTAPSPDIVPVALPLANYGPSPGRPEPPALPSDTNILAAAQMSSTEETGAIAPQTVPLSVTPDNAVKPTEREIVAILPPVTPRRERRYKSLKQSDLKAAQLDVCAKVGKKRVYYIKGNGKYWRCR